MKRKAYSKYFGTLIVQSGEYPKGTFLLRIMMILFPIPTKEELEEYKR